MPRMILKSILVAALIIPLAGCAAISRQFTSAPSEGVVFLPPLLNPHGSIFVSRPDDGGTASLWCVDSGRVVSYAVANAFSNRGLSVHISEKRMTRDDTIRTAAWLKADYAVLPLITRWDPRNTWLGWPSKLSIRVTIVDVATGRVLSSEPINYFNPLSSLVSPAPEVLLEGPLSKYVDGLYRSVAIAVKQPSTQEAAPSSP